MKHSTFSFTWLLVVILSLWCGPATVLAQEGTPGAIDTGDTAWDSGGVCTRVMYDLSRIGTLLWRTCPE